MNRDSKIGKPRALGSWLKIRKLGGRVTAVAKSPILMPDWSGQAMVDERRTNLFVSDSQMNAADKERLATHVKIIERQGLIA